MSEVSDFQRELDRCAHWIKEAIAYAHGEFDLEHIYSELYAGNMQLWPCEDAVIITQIIKYPKRSVLHVLLAGGDMEELEYMHNPIVAWARAHGCSAVSISGRPGWTKSFLKNYGFKQIQVQMIKEI